MKITTRRLAKLIYEELERDGWGDIDPYWFEAVAEGSQDDMDFCEEGLEKVLDRVVERINNSV